MTRPAAEVATDALSGMLNFPDNLYRDVHKRFVAMLEDDRLTRAPTPETWDEHMRADGACRLGVYCARHEFIHGGEADELREKLAKTRNTLVMRVLEQVDARDSCAYVEAKRKESRAPTPLDTPDQAVGDSGKGKGKR